MKKTNGYYALFLSIVIGTFLLCGSLDILKESNNLYINRSFVNQTESECTEKVYADKYIRLLKTGSCTGEENVAGNNQINISGDIGKKIEDFKLNSITDCNVNIYDSRFSSLYKEYYSSKGGGYLTNKQNKILFDSG